MHQLSGICRVLALLPLFLAAHVLLAQNEEAAFAVPRPYDIGRYEPLWARNPFTLKTMPAPAIVSDFAKDMAVGAYFGAQQDPTVVLVNTKTNERLSLKTGETSSTGILLEKVILGVRRCDCSVEIRGPGGQMARLTFDDGYLRQLAGQVQPRPVPVSPQPVVRPPVPSQEPLAQIPSTTGRRQPTDANEVAFVPVIPPALQGILPPSAFAAGAPDEPEAPSSGSLSQEADPTLVASQPAQVLTPPRRRAITAVHYH